MPELPEVEICARCLRRWCLGRRIERVIAQPGTPLRDVTPRALAAGLPGRTVVSVDRIGKQLFLRLDDGRVILIHLGMTGKAALLDGSIDHGTPRFVLELDDGARVALFDSRRFGRVRWLEEKAALAHPEIAKLGPDALEIAARSGALFDRLSRVRSPIKIALLDQRRVAGVGNIYASEALFDAKIHPSTEAAKIERRDMDRLSRAIARAMQRTLRDAGDDPIEYLHDGAETNPFRVYARAGEPCPRCHTAIARMVQGGRSTFYCPSCQPKAKKTSRFRGAKTRLAGRSAR